MEVGVLHRLGLSPRSQPHATGPVPYASVQDCIDRRGERAVGVLRDPEGTDGPLERALADAAAEIDAYIGARHDVPLDPVPAIVQLACVDIGMYRAASDAARLTDEARRRYDDASRLLRDVARGVISLGARDPDPPASATSPAVLLDAPPRVMTRKSLKGIL